MLEGLKKFVPSSLKRKIRSLVSSFTCPFCGVSYDHLETVGLDHPVLKEKQVVGAGERKGGCPNCGSIDRERLVYVHLKHVLHFFQGATGRNVLHIAPEKHLSRVLLQQGFHEYVCGDLFTEGYKYPEHVRNMDVLDIPFPDEHFDLVICNHVLEHVPTDQDAMKEIHRVLKKGGNAILQVPISRNTQKTDEDPAVSDPGEREKRFGQFNHVRIYGQDYPERLRKAGFTVSTVNLAERFPKQGLNKEEDLFIIVK